MVELEKNIDQDNSKLVLSNVAYLTSLGRESSAAMNNNGATSDTGAGTKIITASHILAALTACEKSTESGTWTLAIEMMADLCDAQELVQDDFEESSLVFCVDYMTTELQRRHHAGESASTNPINLAAYLGLRGPLMALVRRAWRKPARVKLVVRALIFALRRCDVEMVEELAANINPRHSHLLAGALNNAIICTRRADISRTILAVGRDISVIFTKLDEPDGPRGYSEMKDVLDELSYPVQASWTFPGEVVRW
ncbi:hypothetical protein IMZ48_45595 [Candidatus Bathyarchaeota archaeon]|nr:hypothetical protein [Candidatus Bathyarchaeota archaeon]